MMMEVFAMESVLLRTRKIAAAGNTMAHSMCSLYLREAMSRIETAAVESLAASLNGEPLRKHVAAVRNLCGRVLIDSIQQRREVAERLLAPGRYAVA
jgi:Acyl-CoA dehydrogenase, C-terminal domain